MRAASMRAASMRAASMRAASMRAARGQAGLNCLKTKGLFGQRSRTPRSLKGRS